MGPHFHYLGENTYLCRNMKLMVFVASVALLLVAHVHESEEYKLPANIDCNQSPFHELACKILAKGSIQGHTQGGGQAMTGNATPDVIDVNNIDCSKSVFDALACKLLAAQGKK